jgi:hypothetical protein
MTKETHMTDKERTPTPADLRAGARYIRAPGYNSALPSAGALDRLADDLEAGRVEIVEKTRV